MGPANRPVLVLGASGKLGRMLRRHWQDNPPEGLTPFWQYRRPTATDGIEWRPGEAPPPELPPKSVVLALWGVTRNEGQDFEENTRLALAANELATQMGADRVLHCSSAAVYQPGPEPLAEPDAGGSLNAYGQAKLHMEQAVAVWAARNPQGPKCCAMRLANVIGADSLFAAIGRGTGKVTLDRFESGEGPRRSYVSIPALARACATLLKMPAEHLPPTLNVALPAPYAMSELARAAGCGIAWRPAPDSAAPTVTLQTTRLSQLCRLHSETPEDLIAGWRKLRDNP